MGVFELFFLIVVVVLAGALAVWLIGYWAPGHPGIIDKAIWFVVIAVIIVALINAFGLLAHDPQIPRLR